MEELIRKRELGSEVKLSDDKKRRTSQRYLKYVGALGYPSGEDTQRQRSSPAPGLMPAGNKTNQG